MYDTMTRWLSGVSDTMLRWNLRKVMEPMVDRFSTQALNSAGLVINAGGAAFPKIGAADFYASVAGILVKIAAGTAMPALTGINAPAGGFNVALFFVDSAGVVTAAGGTAAATLGGVVFPQSPKNKALIGFVIVTNAGAFTGGTTALDGATTAVYVNPVAGPFDPTILV